MDLAYPVSTRVCRKRADLERSPRERESAHLPSPRELKLLRGGPRAKTRPWHGTSENRLFMLLTGEHDLIPEYR